MLHDVITESRYLVAGNTLLILDVGASDADAYSCLARHTLTAVTKRAPPATLTVTGQYPRCACVFACLFVANGRVCTATSSSSAPRLVATGGELSVAAGQPACLPCVTSDHPAPQYT